MTSNFYSYSTGAVPAFVWTLCSGCGAAHIGSHVCPPRFTASTSNPFNATAASGNYFWPNCHPGCEPQIDAPEPRMLAPIAWHCPGCGHYYAPSVTVCPETHE